MNEKLTRSELCMIINMLYKENEQIKNENKMLKTLKIDGSLIMTDKGIFKEKHFTNK